MAAVEMTFSGILYDKLSRTARPVMFVGEAYLTGLGVGGGPVYPPEQAPPDHIWGPTDPRPTPPIANVPGAPGYRPPSPGHPAHPIVLPGDPSWGDPHPEHPIVMPPDQPPPTGEPDDDGFLKPPPPDGGWAYHETYKWGLYPKPGQPGPKK